MSTILKTIDHYIEAAFAKPENLLILFALFIMFFMGSTMTFYYATPNDPDNHYRLEGLLTICGATIGFAILIRLGKGKIRHERH